MPVLRNSTGVKKGQNITTELLKDCVVTCDYLIVFPQLSI